MKSKFVNLITISLATSVLVAPVPKAFGLSVESKTTIKELQPLTFDVESSSGEIQSSGLIQQGKATKSMESLPTTAASQVTQSSQSSSVEPTNQVSNMAGGLFVTFVFMVYILIGLQHRKHRLHRAAVLVQQIETLERIWRMNPQKR
jgi:predicted PurR-regulated permease PerM